MMEDAQNVDSAPPTVEEGNVLAALLKAPEQFARRLREDRTALRDGAVLLAAGLAFHAVFGFACGLFGGLSVAVMAACKGVLIALFSLLLCLPSLYVFCCLGGGAISMRQAFALGGAASAMTGLILVALAPVAWLFAVSTSSLLFVTMLNVFLWGAAILFVPGVFRHFTRTGADGQIGPAGAWLLVYLLVTLQMATTLRPLLVEPDDGKWFVSEKRFFLAQFGLILEDQVDK